MGRSGKNRRRRKIEKVTSDDSSNDGSDSGDKERYEGQLGSYTVKGRKSTSDTSTAQQSQSHNTPQRHRKSSQAYCHHKSSRDQYASKPRSVDQDAFVARSQLFKQQLLLSIEQTLKHVEQWWWDDDPGEDEMDWQPEAEVVVPQPMESIISAKHAWKPAPVLEGHCRLRLGSLDLDGVMQ